MILKLLLRVCRGAVASEGHFHRQMLAEGIRLQGGWPGDLQVRIRVEEDLLDGGGLEPGAALDGQLDRVAAGLLAGMALSA